jgi:hypothetical protein
VPLAVATRPGRRRWGEDAWKSWAISRRATVPARAQASWRTLCSTPDGTTCLASSSMNARTHQRMWTTTQPSPHSCGLSCRDRLQLRHGAADTTIHASVRRVGDTRGLRVSIWPERYRVMGQHNRSCAFRSITRRSCAHGIVNHHARLLPHLGFTYVTDDVMNNPWHMAAELLVLIRRRADRALDDARPVAVGES